MPEKETTASKSHLYQVVIFAGILCVLVAGGWLFLINRPDAPRQTETATATAPAPEPVRVELEKKTVIDFGQIEKDADLKTMQQARKYKFGILEGVDMVVRPDEFIKVGDITISMQEIIDKIRMKEGDIIEKDVDTKTRSEAGESEFGIHVVRPGENIWNLHFNMLKDFFSRQGVSVAPLSDEPDHRGRSTGIGKLLKFSENMVYIYNIEQKRLEVDLDLIQPLNKIIIYHMNRLFALLNQIDYATIDYIEFDGKTIWIPAESP